MATNTTRLNLVKPAVSDQFNLNNHFNANWDSLDAKVALVTHSHAAGDISSGTLPLVRGGTNATDAAGARTSLGVPPIAHATNANTYGYGDGTNAGHVRVTAGNGLSVSAGTVAMAAANGTTAGAVTGSAQTFAGKKTFGASTASGASITLPHGATPTSPVNGDVWTTSDGVFARIGGATKDLTQGGTPTFVYKCTGTNDDAAIETLINNFFSSGTAMSMKLMVSGTMGLRSAPPSGTHLTISAANTRGAVCHLDFSDCTVPTITANKLWSSNQATRFNITGLVFKCTTNSGVPITLANDNTHFLNCDFTREAATTISTYDTISLTGNDTVFVNCTFSFGSTFGVGGTAGKTVRFIGCTLSRYNSANSAVAMIQNVGIYRFINCSLASIGNTAAAALFGSNTYVHLQNCTVAATSGFPIYGTSGTGSTLIADSCTFDRVFFLFSGPHKVSLNACKIINSTYGIDVNISNTDAEIKLSNCAIQGTTEDIRQTSASSVKWSIVGCSFSQSGIIVDAASANSTTRITTKLGANCFMPQYANQFSRTIV